MAARPLTRRRLLGWVGCAVVGLAAGCTDEETRTHLPEPTRPGPTETVDRRLIAAARRDEQSMVTAYRLLGSAYVGL